jgi:hypothetical protein
MMMQQLWEGRLKENVGNEKEANEMHSNSNKKKEGRNEKSNRVGE